MDHGTEVMKYDYDIIVIGGGPAGMAAALRARWLRTYQSVPTSVAIVDPNGLGGLSNWKTVLVSGPSWGYTGDELSQLFEEDFKKYPVTLIREEVFETELKSAIKTVKTSGDHSIRTPCIVITSGLKRVVNEQDFLGKGLIPTLKDHQFMSQVLEDVCSGSKGKSIVFIGTYPVIRLWNYFERINHRRLNRRLVIEPPVPKGFQIPPHAFTGKLVRIEGGDWVKGIVIENGKKEGTIESDLVVIDFESYMLFTNATVFADRSLKVKEGFVKVDREMATNLDGVFAAGDITGPPFCVAKSIGEGVIAGFNAYRYTFRRKFKIEPPIYAFYPSRAKRMEPEKTGFNIPSLKGTYRLKILVPNLADQGDDLEAAIVSLLDGSRTLKEVKAVLKEHWPIEQVDRSIENLYQALLKEKKLTIHT